MKDKEWNTQKKRIRKLISKWHYCLGLKWWKVTHNYSENNIETHIPGRSALATCDTDWEYLQSVITWNMPEVLLIDDEQLEINFLHECSHILVREMREWEGSGSPAEKIKHEERVVSFLARAFLTVRKEGGEDAIAQFNKKKKLDNPIKQV